MCYCYSIKDSRIQFKVTIYRQRSETLHEAGTCAIWDKGGGRPTDTDYR